MLGTAPLGTVSLGCQVAAAGTVTGMPDLDIRVIIGGVDVSGLVMLDSLHLTDEINVRPEAEFRVVSEMGNLHFAIGAPVQILYNGVLRFGGEVDELDEEVYDNTVAIFIDVTCTGYAAIMDRHVVNRIFEAMSLRAIVVSIVDADSGPLGETARDDGIRYTDASICLGPTMVRIVFKDTTAAECLDKLCELSGYSWWVDQQKVLHVEDSATLRAPLPLNEIIHANFGETRHHEDRDAYRNIQILVGGKTRTPATSEISARRERFVADGEERTWTVQLPLAAKPRIWVDSVEIDAADIGVSEVDEDMAWTYEIDSERVSQSSEVEDVQIDPLDAGTIVEICYQGYYEIKNLARNQSEVDARAAVEGTSGTYVDVESDDEIDDFDLANELTQALLRRNGRIPRSITCKTTTPGYQAGQLVEVFLPEYGASGDWLIQRVEWEFHGWDEEEPFRYLLEVVNGEPPGGWAEFYRRAADKGRRLIHAENEKIHSLYHFRDTLRLSDTLHVLDGDVASTWPENWLMLMVYGMASIGRQRQGELTGSGKVAGPLYGLEVIP